MVILGIESSCDETAVALVERGEVDRILGEKIKSQIPVHRRFGGVVPELASRNHYEAIDHLTRDLFFECAPLEPEQVSLIAYTRGPGLMGSLLVGQSFARALSYKYHIPLIGVDHIQAHIQSAFIEHPDLRYPLLALVVSGGHTSIYLQEKPGHSRLLSKTRDDAVGEVLDKTAKFFGLGYPGGPVLDRLASKRAPGPYKFTPPHMSDGSADFSFSGYKTAMINLARRKGIKPHTPDFFDLIASFLHALTDYLLAKMVHFETKFRPPSLIVAGGVSRNSLLREKFSRRFSSSRSRLYFPSPRFCTDNASMIAWLGYDHFRLFPDQDRFDYRQNVYSRSHREPGKPHR